MPGRTSVNVFPALKAGDFFDKRLTFQPDTEDVLSSVDIAIMRGTTLGTSPVSYSKRAPTFRTTVGNAPAARARLGSASFVGFDVDSVVPSGLVRKLTTECRPAGVEDRFRHLGLCQLGGTHIADDDQLVRPGYRRRLPMQMVTTSVGNLGVDCLDPPLVLRPLSEGERRLVLAVVLQRRNLIAGAKRGEFFQAKIDPDVAPSGRQIRLDFALKRDIPVATRVLGKASCFDIAAEVARFPELRCSDNMSSSSAPPPRPERRRFRRGAP